MRKILKSQDGVVLLDSLVALLILGISLIAVAGVFGQAAKSTKFVPKSTVVANIAQKEFEHLKSSSKSNWTDFLAAAPTPENAAPVNPDDPNDTYTVTIDKPELKTIGDGKTVAEVAVTVSWLDKAKKNYSRKYVAYYSKPE